jgi:serine/threonine-protein kinase/endoribonuclease IRE1
LHDNKIIHRDLNPRNILYSLSAADVEDISRRPVMKLADFGMSRLVQEDVSHLTRTEDSSYSRNFKPLGTNGWIAPEILNGERTYKESVDIFPLGLIFAFTLSGGRHPFDVDPPKENETKEEAIRRTTIRNERIRKKVSITLNAQQLNGISDQNNRVALLKMIKSMLNADPNKRPTTDQIHKDYITRIKRYTCMQVRSLSCCCHLLQMYLYQITRR